MGRLVNTADINNVLMYEKSNYGIFAVEIDHIISEIVSKCPTIEQEPKTGHWIKDECGNIICSECKRFRRDCRYGHTNFCNHCGARMESEKE